MVLGTPSRVTAIGTKAFTGVDAQTSMLLEHAERRARRGRPPPWRPAPPTTAVINGTKGRIEIEGPFYAPASYTRRRSATAPRPPRRPSRSRATACGCRPRRSGRCLRAGLTESPVMPLDETLAIMRTMDEARRQTGLVYPGEA